jgi:hypothetical protein
MSGNGPCIIPLFLHQGADSKVQHLGIIFSDRGSREAALIHANQQEHLMAIDVKTIERGALHEAKEFFWVFIISLPLHRDARRL